MSTAVPPRPNNEDTATNTRIDQRSSFVPAENPSVDRRDVVARQKEEFGGMKFGSAFFGWLAATGMAVLLTALVAGAGTAVGLGSYVNVGSPTAGNVQTFGLVGGIVLLVIIFIAYYCGGYVAGRMARFNGIKQGIAVWLWAIIIAIIVAIIAAIAGTKFAALGNLNGVPRIPVNGGSLTTAGIVTAVGVAVVSLVAAILGGLTGMRFHRRVDKAGLG
jgi:hypothetical protein